MNSSQRNTELLELELLFEEIDAREAYTDMGSIKTVLKGKRDVGFAEIGKKYVYDLEKHNIGVIIVHDNFKRKYDDKSYSVHGIIYRRTPEAKQKALRLFDIIKSKGGFLKDVTKEEAREIGKLLGYTDKSIEEYINKKYGSKIPLRTDTPDDLHEQNFPGFEKQITHDEIAHDLNKKLIKIVKDYGGKDLKVCAVNADFVRDPQGLNFNGFTDGGTYYVTSLPGYKDNIPEDEAWIDDVFLSKPNDMEAIILHEWTERDLMKYFHVGYDTAHAEYAEKAETLFRSLVINGANMSISQKIHDKFIEEYKKKRERKSIKEEYQFNKMKRLF